ncbi:MAG: PLP-dependent aminotransferase family protein [Hyphomicrobiales bacterium]|nr:PLP-dependent aminotransferase family protein [Hyphomicrobiales bacterium]
MRDALFHLGDDAGASIQSRIRGMLVSAILDGQLAEDAPLPSSRKMAQLLGVARNTVVLVYQGLVDDGYLVARERSGFYVRPGIREGQVVADAPAAAEPRNAPDWSRRFRVLPAAQANVERPRDWQTYPYPFIYGQVDRDLFPLAEWRECSRQALGRKVMEETTSDIHGYDDPMLVEQIRTRLLPRRGIRASDRQILITLGAQNALYLLASLLVTARTTVALEEPGYPDVRNIMALRTARLRPIEVDALGLPVDDRLDGCDYVFVTPSHQSPTTVTMPLDRRRALLNRAADQDFLIIEDDYEAETNYVSNPTPAIKSLDGDGRVIYIGSLSKTLFPGLRLGYLVGPARLIEQARALRRLMLRHAPSNNQRTAALFLAQGHHDTLVHRLHKAYRPRWQRMGEALARHLPNSARVPTFGGTSYWVRGPEGLDAAALAVRARGRGVMLEPGRIHFLRDDAPGNFFRLGFSSIGAERIEPGIEIIAELIKG